MRLRPMPVVMMSSLTARGSEVTLQALETGAVDFVAKPQADNDAVLQAYAEEIRDKIRAAYGARSRTPAPRPPPPSARRRVAGRRLLAAPAQQPRHRHRRLDRRHRGDQGGADASACRKCRRSSWSSTCPRPSRLHSPTGSTVSCALHVHRGQGRRAPAAGHGLSGAGPFAHDWCSKVAGGYVTRTRQSAEPVNRHRPSVDVLFHSVRQAGRPGRDRRHPHRHGQGRRPRHARDAQGRCLDHRPGPGKLRGLRHAARSGPDRCGRRSGAIDRCFRRACWPICIGLTAIERGILDNSSSREHRLCR